MTLTNYWWLLIWLFLGGAIFGTMPKRRERLGDKTVERWDYLPAILMVLPYIVWAGFRGNWADTGLYRMDFLKSPASLSAVIALFGDDTKDPGFSVLRILLKIIVGNQDKLFFLIIAAFQMLCITFVFRRYSSQYWICIFLFIASTDYMSWMHNGIRQFIASTAVFACLRWWIQKKYVPLIAVILLVSTIHGSALIMLPIIFVVQGRAWNKKTILTLLATMIIMVSIDRFTPFLNDLLQETQYDDMITNEIWTTDDGTNIIRVLVYSVPALLSLFGLKYIRAADNPVMNLCINCSIVTMALYLVASVSSGIYIGRLPIYTTLQGYIALPWMVDKIFEEKSAKLVKTVMVIAFVGFFVYQMRVIWGLI